MLYVYIYIYLRESDISGKLLIYSNWNKGSGITNK